MRWLAVTIGCLVLCNCFGQVTIEKSFGDPSCYQEGLSALSLDNGYWISGTTNCSGVPDDVRSWLLRLNNNGDTLFSKTTVKPNGFVRKTSDGSIIFLGGDKAGLAYDTLKITKADTAGDEIWTATLLFGSCQNTVHDMIETRDGNYVFCGISGVGLCPSDVTFNSFVFKTDTDGDLMWSKVYGGSGNDELFNVREDSGGNLYLFGWTNSRGAGLEDSYLLALNANGDSLWSKTYGTPMREYGYGLDITYDNHLIINEYSDSIYIKKLTLSGDIVWQQSVGIPSGGIYFKALETKDLNYAFLYCESSSTGCKSTLLKTDRNGNVIWKKELNTLMREVYQPTAGSFVLTGNIGTFPDRPNIYFVRFDTSVIPIDTVGVEDIHLEQILLYPNPSRGYLNIQSNAIRGAIDIAIIDVLGRVVSEYLLVGFNGHQQLTLPKLTNGTYLLNIRQESTVIARQRFVIQQ